MILAGDGFNSRRIILLAVSQSPETEPPPLSTTNSAGIYSSIQPPLAIVLLALIFVFFSIGFFSIYIRLRDDNGSVFTTASCDGSWRMSLDPATVEALPAFVYSSPAKKIVKVGGFECAICLSDFEQGETLRMLPRCGHVFHKDCINGWLLRQVTCPVCRAELIIELTGEPRGDLSSHVLIDVR